MLLGLLMFVTCMVEFAIALAISLLGVALSSPDSLLNNKWTALVLGWMPPFFMESPAQIRMLTYILILVAVTVSAKNIILGVTTYLQTKVSQAAGWDVSLRLFHRYLNAPHVWHAQQNTSDLAELLYWRTYTAIVVLAILTVLSQTAIIVLLMAGSFVLAPLASLTLYGCIGVIAFCIYKGTQRHATRLGETINTLTLGHRRIALASLQGIREVQLYRQQKAFEEQYAAYALPVSRSIALQSLCHPMPQWVLESFGMILLLGVVVLLTVKGESLAVVTGTLTLMAGVSWRMLPAANRLLGSLLQLKAYSAPVRKIMEHLATVPSHKEKAEHLAFIRDIRLRNIDFRYPSSSGQTLNDVSLHIDKGSMVGIIGLSGSGKSTLVGILTGLLLADEGEILVDDIAAQPAPGYLKIGYVPQSLYLLDATLAENVAFSHWGEQADEDRVRQCCRMAAIDFLDALPEGIHTELGERGVRLSGGQIQRVGIARALYDNPDLLLFDEATSALDNATEASIQTTINSLRSSATMVVVAHRLSTVRECDVLYWVDGGHIVAYGPPCEILPLYEAHQKAHEAGIPLDREAEQHA